MKANNGFNVSIKQAVWVAIFVCVTMFFYVPVESFLLSDGEIIASMGEVLIVFTLISILSTLVVTGILALLRGNLRTIILSSLFSLGVACYLQNNFLNVDYGKIDGTAINWTLFGHLSITNALVWLAIWLIPLLLVLKFSDKAWRIIRIAAQGLTLLLVITIVALIPSYRAAEPSQGATLYRKDLRTVAQEENIFVFVVDSFDTQYMDRLLADSDVTDMLDGFTYFQNSTGSYSKTNGALPYLLTGRRNLNEDKLTDYLDEAYRSSAFFNAFRDADYYMGIYTDMNADKLSPYANNGNLTNTDAANWKTWDDYYFRMGLAIERYAMFRMLPHKLKQYIQIRPSEFTDYTATSDSAPYTKCDSELARQIAAKGIDVIDHKKGFYFIHLNGSHEPFSTDEKLDYLGYNKSNVIMQTKGVFTLIIKPYLSLLEANDIYDNAGIIIMGDHGGNQVTQPAMVVKPKNSTGALKVSQAPISHADFQATVLAMAGLQAQTEGQDMFTATPSEVHERYFYSSDNTTKNKKGYLPVIWEEVFNQDNLTPSYTYRTFQTGEPKMAHDIAQTLKLGDRVTGKDMKLLFNTGLVSWGEPEYIWLNGKTGVFYFRMDEVPKDGVTVTLSWLNQISEAAQRLIVSYQGQPLADTLDTRDTQGACTFHIPAQYFTNNNAVVLDLSIPNATSGIIAQTSGDARLLSFGLSCVEIMQ